jgi:NTE family protein
MSIRSTLPVSVPRHGHYAAPIPEQGICWAGSAASVKTNLALQGGGTHGAFAWGVLDRLLEDERIV